MSNTLYGVAVLILGLTVTAIGVAGYFAWTRQMRRIAELERELRQVHNSFSAMIAGAAGADRRHGRLEQRMVELQRRLEDMEEVRNTTRPYDEAIRLVRQGANAERLVEELGMSSSEAELLLMLHGSGTGKQGR